jgi:imidazolonepropionase-like amidohydrolase
LGHRADLVILERDPVLDHQALHDIRAVVRSGELWSRADLDATLDRLAAAPSAR